MPGRPGVDLAYTLNTRGGCDVYRAPEVSDFGKIDIHVYNPVGSPDGQPDAEPDNFGNTPTTEALIGGGGNGGGLAGLGFLGLLGAVLAGLAGRREEEETSSGPDPISELEKIQRE